MTITLCKTADENIKVIKTLSDHITLVGALRSECSILNPTIEIETDLNISNYNYAIINEFGRYYFITDITVINHKLWKLSLKCDVLHTYSDDIFKLQVNVLRSYSSVNLMLEDKELNTYSDDRVQCINFPKALTSTSNNQFKYYLAVIGGGE